MALTIKEVFMTNVAFEPGFKVPGRVSDAETSGRRACHGKGRFAKVPTEVGKGNTH